jgi:hypothetical protein
MMSTAARGPLDCIGTLQLVFSYAGAGEFFYFATVSTKWRREYGLFLESVGKGKVTQHDAVLKSAARAYYNDPYRLGLVLPTQLQRRAGKLSDIDTLKALNLRGMPLSAAVFHGIAESGCLYKLKWFGALALYQLPNDICDSAARVAASTC